MQFLIQGDVLNVFTKNIFLLFLLMFCVCFWYNNSMPVFNPWGFEMDIISKFGHIMKTCLFIYIENFTTQNGKFSEKKV